MRFKIRRIRDRQIREKAAGIAAPVMNLVILAISGKGHLSDSLRLFCRELTKARAQNVALMIDGDQAIADNLKATLAEAGTNVIDEVLFVKGGLPIIGGSLKPEEKTEIFAWVDRVIANLK